MFHSEGLDEYGRPLNVVVEISFREGNIFANGRARAYESTLLALVDDREPVVVMVDADGRWKIVAEARIGSLISIGDEDAKVGGMSARTTIRLRVGPLGEVVIR